jgi:uncharacterized protein involved in outer membrane biogenesis
MGLLTKKKILIIFILLCAVLWVGTVYLNKIILPKKIKAFLESGLEEATHKEVSLGSLEFNLFKGLVIKNLKLYDDAGTLAYIKEGSCTFMLLPLFKKQIAISTLKLISLEVFLERRPDNTFNIAELFFRKQGVPRKGKLSVLVYKVRIINGCVHFRDNTFSPAFVKSIDSVNLTLFLSLPLGVKFNLKSKIASKPLNIEISGLGEYRITDKEFNAQLSIKDFSPREFLSYYKNLGASIPEGTIDALVNLNLKDDALDIDSIIQTKKLRVSKDKVAIGLNSEIETKVKYGLKDKKFIYSGTVDILKSNILGLEFIDRIADIEGKIGFNNAGISSDKLKANILGVPVEAKASLTDFNNPLLDVYVTCGLDLNFAKKILKDKFKFDLPVYIQGQGDLALDIKTNIPSDGSLQLDGRLDIINAKTTLDRVKAPLDSIYGRVRFTQDSLEWSELNFQYQDNFYKTNGRLTNFKAPSVQLDLSSKELLLESGFTIKDKMISISKCKGRYKNSQFLFQATVDISKPPALEADGSGEMDLDLKDARGLLKKYENVITKIDPAGLVHAKFNLKGNIKELKNSTLGVQLSSSSLSILGLKSQDFLLNYSQAGGLADIERLYLSLYDGTVEANAKMNLNSQNLPFWVAANIQGIKIEKLKLDTPAREKDISGTLQAEFKVNGFSNDLSKLSGEGKIIIKDGNLWQLNLFKGLGELIFAEEFASIVFSQGSAGFTIKDKYISTDSLKLKSNFVDLVGSCKIGLDNSIDASLNIQVLDEFVPLTGTLKDFTTAIIGRAGRFGIIQIQGTLQQPKYKFRPAVGDILKSLKDAFIGNIF